ncbi:MAG: triphosphoribosyl-dephospho-CoA synthase [Gammaproteobacteria bacterium]|nr:triphosphoribosyl-dephospho-CoA synthase [Gammaproteobacteria bacterium]
MRDPVANSELIDLYTHACWIDIQALKPGNTSIYSDTSSPGVGDFLESAKASAPPLVRPDLTLGNRILQAVQATHKAVGTNTNLGIILLIAPLIHAWLARTDTTLEVKLGEVLAHSSVQDTKYVFQAIRAARPGGLGRADEQDVYEEPTVSLLNAMELSSSKDLIAHQYSSNFHDIFHFGMPYYRSLLARWDDECWAASGVYLAFLARYPDSLVARKYGMLKAREISDMITPLEKEFCRSDSPVRFKSRLLEIDSCLKRDRINPGTTADLTVASIFAEGLGML